MLSQMKFGDFQLALLVLTALVAFAIDLHGNVKRGSYLGASLNALMVCIYHLALFKIARNVMPADVLAYLTGWPLGVIASTAFYKVFWRKSPKPVASTSTRKLA